MAVAHVGGLAGTGVSRRARHSGAFAGCGAAVVARVAIIVGSGACTKSVSCRCCAVAVTRVAGGGSATAVGSGGCAAVVARVAVVGICCGSSATGVGGSCGAVVSTHIGTLSGAAVSIGIAAAGVVLVSAGVHIHTIAARSSGCSTGVGSRRARCRERVAACTCKVGGVSCRAVAVLGFVFHSEVTGVALRCHTSHGAVGAAACTDIACRAVVAVAVVERAAVVAVVVVVAVPSIVMVVEPAMIGIMMLVVSIVVMVVGIPIVVVVVVRTIPVPVVERVVAPAPSYSIAAVEIRTVVICGIPPAIAQINAHSPIVGIVGVPVHIGVIVVVIAGTDHGSVETTETCRISVVVIVVVAVNHSGNNTLGSGLFGFFAFKDNCYVFLFQRIVDSHRLLLHTCVVRSVFLSIFGGRIVSFVVNLCRGRCRKGKKRHKSYDIQRAE